MKRERIILAAIILFAALLWSANLGNLPLWEDEAHTALLGRSILSHGLPAAWDGQNLISGVQAEDFNDDFIVTWDQPLQFYVTALSIKLFGMHNWVARLPFLLAGLLSIILLYLFVAGFTKDKNLALLSAFIFSVSVIFILHTRQCRYYSLGTFSTLLLYLSYIEFDSRRWARLALPASLVFLFYSNLMMFVTSAGSLIIFRLFFDPSRQRFKRLALSSAASLPFVLPWFVYARLWDKEGPHAGISIASKLLNIFEMALKFNRAFFPLLILLIAVFLLLRKRLSYDKRYYYLILTTIIFPLIFVPVFLLPGIRYIVYLIPFCAFLTALLTAEIFERRRLLAVLFLTLITFTKVFSNIGIILPQWALAVSGLEPASIKESIAARFDIDRAKLDEALHKAESRIRASVTPKGMADSLIKMEYPGYLYEITHDYKDPIEVVATFLNENASPGDEVMIPVGAFSMMLYAPGFRYAYVVEQNNTNKVRLAGLPEYVYSYENVKWFIPRTIQKIKGPFISEEEFLGDLKRRGIGYRGHIIDCYTFDWDGSRPESFSRYALQHSPRARGPEKVMIYEIVGSVKNGQKN